MSTRVKTLYLSSFNMPGKCVACGEESDPEFKWKASWGQLEKDKHTLSIEFPLCTRCGNDIKNNYKKSAKFFMGVFILLSPIACFLTSGVINSFTKDEGYWGILTGIAVFVLFIFLGTLVRDRINTAGFTPEQKQEWKKQQKLRKDQQKKINKCVKIANVKLPSLFSKSDGGSIDFEFENMLFAMEFATLNLGQLTNK